MSRMLDLYMDDDRQADLDMVSALEDAYWAAREAEAQAAMANPRDWVEPLGADPLDDCDCPGHDAYTNGRRSGLPTSRWDVV